MALTPRMEPYARLLFRLYEALVLLSIIRPIGGAHVVSRLGNYTTQDVRRRFLKNLAFLCDYRKGGSTAAAIAVEDRSDCYVFWVALNEGAGDKVMDFLKDVLKRLRVFCERFDDRVTAEEALVARCTVFGATRLRQESRILRSSANKCRISLESSVEEADAKLIKWLRRFEDNTPDAILCRTAYRSRKDHEMRRIEQLGHCQDSEDFAHPDDITKAFRAVRHMIGRLAARIRSVNQLLDDSKRMENLLKTYQVAAVRRPISASVPEADAHTTLPRILNRILPETDSRYNSYLGFLQRMNPQVDIEARLHNKFEVGGLLTCIHAEVQMLHHFFESGRRYVSADRYIACSKPACVGCESYTRHHPARVTLLDAHKKVYPNWGIVSLVGGKQNPGWINQRKIINDVIGDLKPMVIDHLGELHAATLRRPDSLTEITASLVDESDTGSETEGLDGSEAGPSSEGECTRSSTRYRVRTRLTDLVRCTIDSIQSGQCDRPTGYLNGRWRGRPPRGTWRRWRAWERWKFQE
ncbi:hypothetical protein BDP55DRAFT_556971 [Colletotrichum godetiae]|uniref:Uncharacterized protein n=1 Tax=Colletotrichum godetiae TaxID=1209918 RepID=A0AAJ0EVD4_9PEZI|nr:uncharacterized protein BDP55DRAFT_556971 [Colletotrichum godetiae]KAK1673150.1 hypothetical protein BDP55DRAFT_556971 [Colletotrichum godetiae]